MKYRKNKLKDTVDNKTWKIIYIFNKFGCPICGPNSGCNRKSKKKNRNWKEFRKTQYKNETKTKTW